jgi:SAM-dependent methyltransferase
MEEIEKLINELIEQQMLVRGVVSSPNHGAILKVTIRPLLIKGEYCYQFTSFDGKQTRDLNASPGEAKQKLLELVANNFKQALLSTAENDYQLLISSKGKATLLKKKGQRALTLLDHNRKKEYLLAEGQPIPFLVELGVMTAEGKVVAKRYHKFKQINRFLELIEDLLPALSKERPLTIIDFGCGKSYLTFALYHFLTASGYQLNIVGLDLKKEVIENCNALAKKLGYQGLSFQVGEISGYSTDQPVDMVVVLHACDTATDEALAQAVQWKSRVILAVPCCQHQLYSQIKSEELAPLLKHGIMKERFAALATDALRAMKLEIEGYKTQILEFIDMEHTPKNLLIRAIRQEKKGNTDKLEQDYRQFKKLLNIEKNLHP